MSPVFGHGRLRLYLLQLLEESPRHGYEVIRLLEDRFLGLYAPSAGTVYPRLQRMESEGLVTHDESEGRKVYRLTDAGRAELEERRGELAGLEAEIAGSVHELASDVRADVRESVRDLRTELRAAARDVRRQDRHTARAGARPASSTVRELEKLLELFRAEARAAVRSAAADADIVGEARRVLDDALARWREVLTRVGR